MELLLVRHAESMGNATGDYSIAAADTLSPTGLRQAVRLAGSLGEHDFDEVVVSPLQRAMQTAAPYLQRAQRQAQIWPEVAEACWHDDREPVAPSWNTEQASVPGDMNDVFAFRDGDAVRPAGPESFGEGLRRVHATADRLQTMATEASRHLLMVSHGHFIRELLNLLLGTRETVRFPHDNCGMTALSFNGRWALEFCNREGTRPAPEPGP